MDKPHISIRYDAGSHTNPLRNGYQLGIDHGTWPCPWNISKWSYFWSTVMACDGKRRGLWNDKIFRSILFCIAWNVLLTSFPSPVWNTWLIEFWSWAILQYIDVTMSLKADRETIGRFSYALHANNLSTQSQLQRLLQTNTRLVAEAPRWHKADAQSSHLQLSNQKGGTALIYLYFKWDT